MASLNKVMIIGNAGRDAEMRFTANGTALTNFSVAVNRNFRRDGEWQSETEWFNVTVWGEAAERIGTWLTKGKQVYVEGRLQTRSWENEDGVKQFRTEIVADKVLPLGRREEEGGFDRDEGFSGGAPAGERPRGNSERPQRMVRAGGGSRDIGGDEIDPDDLPFE
jgi:single-strand DNA-binding protein